MLTEIGKFLRKVRIDRNLLLKDMALGLEVSPAYLSTVETGKKTFSDDFVRKIAQFLGFAPGSPEYHELEEAAILTRGQIQLPIQGMTNRHQEVAMAFSRQFEEMQPTDLDKILAVLKESQK